MQYVLRPHEARFFHIENDVSRDGFFRGGKSVAERD
jgi:hypothetical protein